MVCQKKLQLGITVGVDQSVQTAALLAEGAVVVVIAVVVGQVSGLKDGGQLDLAVLQMLHGAEQAGNTDHIAAVVLGALDAALCGKPVEMEAIRTSTFFSRT